MPRGLPRILLMTAMLGGLWPAGAVLVKTDFLAPGDGLLVVDTTTGLGWLSPIYTRSHGYNDATVQTLISTYGFRYATGPEALNMINTNFGNPPTSSPGTVAGATSAQSFFDTFGKDPVLCTTSSGTVPCPRLQGLTSESSGPGNHLAFGMFIFDTNGWAIINNPWPDMSSSSQLGSWLVRAVPAITNLSPPGAYTVDRLLNGSFELIVDGLAFTQFLDRSGLYDPQVKWDGTVVSTVFVGNTRVRASVPYTLLTAGDHLVTVCNQGLFLLPRRVDCAQESIARFFTVLPLSISAVTPNQIDVAGTQLNVSFGQPFSSQLVPKVRIGPTTLNANPSGGSGLLVNVPIPQGTFQPGTTQVTAVTPLGGVTNSLPLTVNQQQVQTLITTNAAGLSVDVDGTTYSVPRTFLWTAGSQHTVSATTPQSGSSGTQYRFRNWSDSGAAQHAITVGASNATYTANFDTYYLLTTPVTPAGGGTILRNPASGDNYYLAGNAVQLTAQAANGFDFASWSGDASGASASTAVTMNGPRTATANFSALGSVTVTTSVPGLFITVDGTQYTAPHSFSWPAGSQHSVSAATQQTGPGTRNQFAGWNDGGAATHTVTASGSATTYIAAFDTLYQLTIAASPAAFGSVSANPPSSDGYYLSGSTVQVTAQAVNGYSLSTWSGDATGSASSVSLTMSGPKTATASFSQIGATTVTTIPSGLTVIVDGTSYTTPASFNWISGSQHALSTLSPQTGPANQSYTFSGWSQGGGQSQTVTASSTQPVYTASFQAQGQVTSALRFVPLAPCRVMETRAPYNFEGRAGAFGPPTLNAAEIRTLNLPVSNVCSIPATAKAYVVNTTVIPPGPLSFVTVWPAGEARPNVWTIRSPDGQVVANSAIVKAGTNGGISVYASERTDLLIDISGYYTDDTGPAGLVYYPLTPCRVVETRAVYRSPAGPFGPPSMTARQARKFTFPATPYCTVPRAAAYSVTITVVPPGPLAFLTAWPDGGAQPNVSSINSFVGRVLANSVIVPAASDGSIDVFAYDATDVLVDINGYFGTDDGTGLYYYPVTQCRASEGAYADDTARTINIPGAGGCSGIPANAKGYAINVTALPNGNPMPFLTAWPTGSGRPNASILNAFQGQIVSNSAIIPAGTNGAIDVYAFRRTDVVVEVSGYFGR